ncbi:MAG: DUF2452 domain-containing protein [Bdellovibrionales bacterium]|nr:DUF2452 domain-containing protein [Bdellovibrionales bacterium]
MSDEKKPSPIDVNKINLELMKLKVTDMPSLLEYAHTVGGFSIVPTNEGQIKNHAREAMKEQTEEQLNLIFEQMKTLARQVQDIQKRVHISDLIYNAEIKFTLVVGKTYFLYETSSEKRYLSLISPKEWGSKLEDKFIAEIRLNADHTWKVMNSNVEGLSKSSYEK